MHSYLGTSLPPLSLFRCLRFPRCRDISSLPEIHFVEILLHIDVICHAVKGSNALAYAVGYKDVVNRQLTKQVVKRHFFIEGLHREIYGEVSTTN